MHNPLNRTVLSRFRDITCIFAVLFAFINAKAQTADVPRIISYQGQVTLLDGSSMTGTHHIVATLYSDRFGKTSVWRGEYDAAVTNGLFSVLLGSGKYKLLEASHWINPFGSASKLIVETR